MLKLLIVLGEGGHSKEMLTLVGVLGDEYAYSYLLTHEDMLSGAKIEIPGPLYRVIRPRSKDDPNWLAGAKLLLCACQSFLVMLRERPHAVVHCGPAVAIPISLWAKLFHRAVIFVETGSRIHRPSLTGRLMRRLADLYFVQWPELRQAVPEALYAGRLF